MEQIKLKKKIFLQKIPFKFPFDFWKFENLTDLFSFDRKMMRSYNVWPLDRVDIKLSLFTILIFIIPGVSIVDAVTSEKGFKSLSIPFKYIYCFNNKSDMLKLTFCVLELINFHLLIVNNFTFFIKQDKLKILMNDLMDAWTKSK